MMARAIIGGAAPGPAKASAAHDPASIPHIAVALALALATALGSCILVDLRPIDYALYPSAAYQVLADDKAAVWVEFAEEVDKDGAERAFSVECEGKKAQGDYGWSGNRLRFTPSPPWEPGKRYVLLLEGDLRAAGGRTDTLRARLPFTALRPAGGPELTEGAVVDADGAAIADLLRAPANARFRLDFSEPMDKESVRRALTLSPAVDCDYAWSADARALVVAPKERLAPLARYGLSLAAEAEAAADGARLVAKAELWCFTGADSTPPAILNVRPARYDAAAGAWVADAATLDAAGETLAATRITDAIVLDLSEDCDLDSLRAAFKLEPALDGVVERLGPGRFLYRPLESFRLGTRYTVSIATELEDLAGLKLASAWRAEFVCATPWLAIEGIAIDGDADADGDGDPGSAFGAAQLADAVFLAAFHDFDAVTPPAPGDPVTSTITISFGSPMVGAAAKAAAVAKVSFSRLFPSSTANPTLVYATWTSDAVLVLRYEDIAESGDASASTETVRFYSLRIGGGQGGVQASDGSYMEKDLVILLREVHE